MEGRSLSLVWMRESKLEPPSSASSHVDVSGNYDFRGFFGGFVSHFGDNCHSRYFVYFSGKLETDSKR